MKLIDAQSRFAKAGLFTALNASRMFLARLAERQATDVVELEVNGEGVQFSRILIDGKDTWLGDEATIDQIENGWRFKNDPPTVFGGPCLDFFSFRAKSLKETVDAAWRYYFGTPLVLDGWRFPVHRHPHWNCDAIRLAFERARLLSWVDFRALCDESEQLSKGVGVDKDGFLATYFYPIHRQASAPSTDLKLFLRMDCQVIVMVPSVEAAAPLQAAVPVTAMTAMSQK